MPMVTTSLELLKRYFRSVFGVAFTVIVLMYFISIFYTSNLTDFWSIFKNKLPFLFIPLSILSIGKLEKKQTDTILYVFLFCLVFSSIWSFVQYLKHKELYTKLYTTGQVMPTLIHHVSLSLLVSFGILVCLFQLIQKKSILEQIVFSITGIWLVFFVHILSVRTGIVLTYLSIFLLVLFLLLRFKKPLFASFLAVFILLSAILAYQQLPTVKHKIDYTFYGLTQYKSGQDSTNQISDARRILSDQIGLELIQKHPLIGIGFGDIQNVMNQIYTERYPLFSKDVYAHIHNQYVYVFTGAGILLGVLFIAALLAVLLQFWKEENTLFVILYLLLLVVMLWEPFIENQLGTSIFLFICSLGMLSKTSRA